MPDTRQSFEGPHKLYLFRQEIYLLARSYQILAADIKSLIKNALVWKRGSKSRILPFLAFFELSVLAQPFGLKHWFFTKIGSIYVRKWGVRIFFRGDSPDFAWPYSQEIICIMDLTTAKIWWIYQFVRLCAPNLCFGAQILANW